MVSDHVVVVPSIWQPYTDACLATMKFDGPVIVIDNTLVNTGCAASWNTGLRAMMADPDKQWCIIVSAAMRFAHGGMDFVQRLRDDDMEWGALTRYGWHYAAVSKPMVELIGYFDENFWPGYMEDTDYMFRMHIAGLNDPQVFVPRIDALDDDLASIGHAIQLAGVRPDGEKMEQYWQQKWGRPSNAYDLWDLAADVRPFGDRPLGYWPVP